jgi:DNA processing protein
MDDGPIILFVQGNCDLNFERSVGIVGTRSATAYGKSITRKIIEDLLPYQPIIVSGLAYGIDIEAHRAALQVGLPTIAVMGSPLSQIYPAAHRKTAEQLQETGILMSEKPDYRRTFRRANRRRSRGKRRSTDHSRDRLQL